MINNYRCLSKMFVKKKKRPSKQPWWGVKGNRKEGRREVKGARVEGKVSISKEEENLRVREEVRENERARSSVGGWRGFYVSHKERLTAGHVVGGERGHVGAVVGKIEVGSAIRALSYSGHNAVPQWNSSRVTVAL